MEILSRFKEVIRGRSVYVKMERTNLWVKLRRPTAIAVAKALGKRCAWTVRQDGETEYVEVFTLEP